MNLKDFKVLSKEAYEALDTREQVKYEMQLEAYKEAQIKEKAEEAAGAIFQEKMQEMQDARKKELDELKAANDEALKALAEKYEGKMEDFEATLKRAKIGEIDQRLKGVREDIIAKLSTEEGENMLKAFFKGKREGLNLDVDADGLKAMTVPSGGVAPQFTPIVGPGHDDIHARTVIPVFPTISDIIKFIQITTTGDTAGFETVAEGAQKPDLAYTTAVEEALVRKIAGLLDVSDEMMDDVVGFRAWIAYELPKAYLDAEDMQIFKGDGTGTNLLGLWYQADLQQLPLGTVTSASNVIDKIAAGITEIRILKRGTSAVFVSPVEWMEILINKGTTKDYTYPIVLRADGVMTIGGVPIYWSNVFEEGEGLAGDFSRGTAIFQRKEMTMAYAYEHKDNFGKNIVTIRLEGRIALPIYFPEAFKRLFTATS